MNTGIREKDGLGTNYQQPPHLRADQNLSSRQVKAEAVPHYINQITPYPSLRVFQKQKGWGTMFFVFADVHLECNIYANER